MKEVKIVYEDADLVVVNKPVGLVTTRADSVRNLTLQDWVDKRIDSSNRHPELCHPELDSGSGRGYLRFDSGSAAGMTEREAGMTKSGAGMTKKEAGMIKEEFVQRSGIVHRLDKETSGLIIIAKNIQSYAFLKQQFKKRKVKKKYLALVYGKFEKDKGKVDKPIGVSLFNAQKMAVRSEGKEAVTFWKKLAVFENLQTAASQLQIDDYGIKLNSGTMRKAAPQAERTRNNAVSFLELRPITGRTHQLRVHLKSIRHAVVGDPDYSGKTRYPRDRDVFGRMMLHAGEIGFVHPGSEAWVTYSC